MNLGTGTNNGAVTAVEVRYYLVPELYRPRVRDERFGMRGRRRAPEKPGVTYTVVALNDLWPTSV